MSLVVILLASYLLAGQFVRKWSAPLVVLLALWTAFVVVIHLAILR